MNRRGGLLLLVGLLLTLLTIDITRAVFQRGNGPVSLPGVAGMVQVELGAGFAEQAVHQFIDGSTWRDVINMTDFSLALNGQQSAGLQESVPTGSKIDLLIKERQIKGFELSWMSAAKRIALGIPLHPDRMSTADWQVLPGIGEQMAQRIENNRQKYGDFGVFSNLKRVSGLGKKRLSHWNQYFFTD